MTILLISFVSLIFAAFSFSVAEKLVTQNKAKNALEICAGVCIGLVALGVLAAYIFSIFTGSAVVYPFL